MAHSLLVEQEYKLIINLLTLAQAAEFAMHIQNTYINLFVYLACQPKCIKVTHQMGCFCQMLMTRRFKNTIYICTLPVFVCEVDRQR